MYHVLLGRGRENSLVHWVIRFRRVYGLDLTIRTIKSSPLKWIDDNSRKTIILERTENLNANSYYIMVCCWVRFALMLSPQLCFEGLFCSPDFFLFFIFQLDILFLSKKKQLLSQIKRLEISNENDFFSLVPSPLVRKVCRQGKRSFSDENNF